LLTYNDIGDRDPVGEEADDDGMFPDGEIPGDSKMADGDKEAPP